MNLRIFLEIWRSLQKPNIVTPIWTLIKDNMSRFQRTSSVDASTRFAKRQKSESSEISQDIAEVQGLVDCKKKEKDCTMVQFTQHLQDKPAPPLPMQEGFAISSRSSPNSSAEYHRMEDGQAV